MGIAGFSNIGGSQFGADLIESDDGALQMRVTGGGAPVRIELLNLMGGGGMGSSREGRERGRRGGGSDERAEMRSFLNEMMPGGVVTSHIGGIGALGGMGSMGGMGGMSAMR